MGVVRTLAFGRCFWLSITILSLNIFTLSAIECVFMSEARAQWTVDFSRRSKGVANADLRAAGQIRAESQGSMSGHAGSESVGLADSASKSSTASSRGLIDALFDGGEPVQEIVILNTDKGFVPSTVRVRKNGRYRIHVVNVNDREKNVSFILDGFSEHHATYFGKIKSFTLEAKKEGVFSFLSPETSAEGRLVVFNPQVSIREPATEGER
jgi:hypothetical protein